MNHFFNIPEYDGAAVYCIENVISHKKYIGCSMNLKNRIKSHIYSLREQRHNSNKMQIDYNNGDYFNIEILYKSNVEDEHYRKIDIRIKERQYIEKYKTVENGYNNKMFSVVAEKYRNEKLEDIRQTPKSIISHIQKKHGKLPTETIEKIIEIAKRNNFSLNELEEIAAAVGCNLEITFSDKQGN